MIDLSNIVCLWRQPDTMALYGIPYALRPGQSPNDIVRGRVRAIDAYWDASFAVRRSLSLPSGSVPDDWVWLGSPGWWGHMKADEQTAAQEFLARVRERGLIPEWPCEWSDIREEKAA